MKHLILVSNLENTEFDKLHTSSSKYEYKFAYEMSRLVDKVSMVSPKLTENYCDNNIGFYSCVSGNLQYDIKPIVNRIQSLVDTEEDTVILFWGYNPMLIKAICDLKSDRVKVLSMIYDTHLGAMENTKWYKKWAIDRFYSLGIKKINKLDGVLLFKESAKKRLGIKVRTCIILPTVNVENMKLSTVKRREVYTFLYCGTLCDYNGTIEMLEAFNEFNNKHVRLKIYGNGPAAEQVQKMSEKDKRIIYGGCVSSRDIENEMKKADVLLNLRRVPSIVNDIAFPSKIVEYMETGKIVISTNVSEHKEFADAVFLLKDLRKETILSSFEKICLDTHEIELKTQKTLEYLKEYHDNITVTDRAYTFMFQTLFKES